jgi:hypothetical protein
MLIQQWLISKFKCLLQSFVNVFSFQFLSQLEPATATAVRVVLTQLTLQKKKNNKQYYFHGSVVKGTDNVSSSNLLPAQYRCYLLATYFRLTVVVWSSGTIEYRTDGRRECMTFQAIICWPKKMNSRYSNCSYTHTAYMAEPTFFLKSRTPPLIHSSSWEALNCPAAQEIPDISRNLKIRNSLPWARWIRSMPLHRISLRCN